jgi:outer membrane protein assembly factor BamB
VIVGQGDGWLRSFEAQSGKLIWKCDLNPKDAVYRLAVGTRAFPMASPVYHEVRVFISTGDDPEHISGLGYVYCVDPTKEGDISLELDDGKSKGKPNPKSAVFWRFGGPDNDANAKRDYKFGHTLGNCTIHDDLVYVCDIEGFAFCFDAKTGKLHWQHDTKSEIWATPLWADGKVYVPTRDGDVWIFAHGKEKKLIANIDMDTSLPNCPVFANGTLYLMGENKLYAVREAK